MTQRRGSGRVGGTRVPGIIGVLALAVGSLVATPAGAAPSVEGEPVRVAEYSNGNTRPDMSIAHNPDREEFLAVWAHDPDPGALQVWARRLDADGRPLGAAVGLMTPLGVGGTTNNAPTPEVAYNPAAEEYAVVWAGVVGGPTTTPVGRQSVFFGHRVADTGQPIGGQVRLTPSEGSSYSCSFENPRIDADPETGGYMMVGRYRTSLNDPPGCGAGLAAGSLQFRSWNLAADLDATGSRVISPNMRSVTGDIGFAANPQSGGYLVTWARGNDPTTPSVDESATIARLLGSDGAPVGDPIVVQDELALAGGQAGQVAADPETGTYLVAAASGSSSGPDGLVARRFTATGTRIGDPVQVTASRTFPSDLVATGAGGWVVADINGNIRQLAADGSAVGDAVKESAFTVGLAMGSDPSRVVALLRQTQPLGVESMLISLSSGFESLVPGRLWDSRDPGGATIDDVGAGGGAIAADTIVQVPVAGRAGVPDDADAVSLNVTIVGATAPGFATVWPCGATQPDASNLNYVAGQTIPNSVLTQVGDNGDVCVYTSAATDLLIDVNGAF